MAIMRVTHYQFGATLLVVAALTLGCDVSAGPPISAVPTTGAIKITATTIGVDRAPPGYKVEVRLPWFSFGTNVDVPINGTATVSELQPGDYLLTIFELVPNCERDIASPRSVSVVGGSTTPVALNVTCVTPTQLAFVNGADSDAEIYVVNSDGTGATRLTTQPGADVNPAWSPDGSRITFASQRDGNLEIYVMSANGTNPVRLTNVAASDYRPAWSPDGARIAFVSERDGNAEIYVMNADGTNPTRLTSNDAKDSDPAWSPDGRKIAFVSGRDGNGEIYVMTPDGSGLTRLTFRDLPDAQPVWSPDGTRIAFSGASSFGDAIYVMNADGSSLDLWLKPNGYNGSDPAWSPDGRKILFTAIYCGYYDYGECPSIIQFARTDGIPYSLTSGDRPSEPTWRP